MRKILIIDADMDFLNSLSSDLRAAGYEVETSSFAAAGLEKAPGVSLVIVSVELPDQNGFVVCSHLKGNPATASIPVFITSSADSTAAFERHLNLANHADGYFLKPLDVAAMLQEMAAIFAEIDAGYAMGAEASEPGYAGAEMIDVSDPAEEVAASDDSEVIKALSVDDMNLFGDIDANELSGAEVLGFNESAAPAPVSAAPVSAAPVSAAPVSAAPAPVSAAPVSAAPAPVSAAPVSSVSAAPKLPPRAGSPAATGLPSIGASPAKPVAEKPAGQATITGMPASKSGQGLPRIPAKPANFSTTISNSRIPVSGDFKRPSASISSVSQTAIPAADLSRLNDEITVLNNEITVLKSEITTRDNRITMLQSQCDALTARCNNAEAIASALQTEAEQALQARAEAEAALGEAQAALVQTQTSEAALAEKIAHLTALMDQIQSVLKS